MGTDSSWTPRALEISLRPPQASGLGDGHFRLLLTNAGHTDLAVQLEAFDPEHGLDITFEPPLLVVPAGQERSVPVRVHPRFSLPGEEPRTYPFAIVARPTEFPDWAVQVHGEWKQIAPSFELELRPAHVAGVVEGAFAVHAANHSLEELTLELHAADTAGACTFAFQPAEIVVPAGQSAPAHLRVRARERLPAGEPLVHPFTVTARPREASQVHRQVQGEWEQSLPLLELDLQPLQPRGAAEGIFHLEVRNAGMVELTVGFEAEDPEGACLFTLTPPLVVIPAGQVRPIQVRVQPRVPLRTAEPQPRLFTVTARPAETPGWTCPTEGEWVQLPAPRPAIRTWGPLVLLVFGWALAWGAAALSIPLLGGGNLALDLLALWGEILGLPVALSAALVVGALAGLLLGSMGGLVTALAARWAEPILRRSSGWAIFFGWAFCLLVGGATLAALGHLAGSTRYSAPLVAAHGAMVGLSGGAVMGLALRRALPRARPLRMALGWALFWSVGQGPLRLFSSDSVLLHLFGGLPASNHVAVLVPVALYGVIIGFGGSLVTLSEIARARRQTDM
jgi:hypothetical protein